VIWVRGLATALVLLVTCCSSLSAGAAVVKAIYKGSAVSTSEGTVVVDLPVAVDPSKSVLFFHTRHNNDRPVGSMVRGVLADSTSLNFVRVSNQNSTINIEWQLVEWQSGVNVQRGSTNQTSTQRNVTLSSAVGSTAQAFVLWSKTPRRTDSVWSQDDPITGRLTSTTNLRFEAVSTNNDHIIAYQVVEFTDAADILVQTGTTSIAPGSTFIDFFFPTTVNLSRTFMLSGYSISTGGTTNLARRMITGYFRSGNIARFFRAASDNSTRINIAYQIVELRDGSSVQSGFANFSPGEAVETATLANPVVVENSVAFSGVQPVGGMNAGVTTITSNDIIGEASFTFELATDQLTMQRNATQSTSEVDYFVVEFNALPLLNGESRWLLNEATGTVAADSESNNDGVYTNGVSLDQVGPCGQSTTAALFDGDNDFVAIDHTRGYLIDSGTIGLWARPQQLGQPQTMFSKAASQRDTGGDVELSLTTSGALRATLESTTQTFTLTSIETVTVDEWFHAALTWGGSGMRLYIDGELVASNSYTGGLGSTSGGTGNFEPITIGASTGGSNRQSVFPMDDFFDGFLSDVRLQNTALDEAGILGLAFCPVTAIPTFLVNHDNTGIHCALEPVSVRVTDDGGDLVTNYNREITLDTQSGDGTWQLVSGNGSFADQNAGDGLATYLFDASDNGAASFALSYQEGSSPLDIDVFETADPSIRDNDAEGALAFFPSGFTVTAAALTNPVPALIDSPIQTQISGTAFAVHLTAFGQTPDDPTCGVIESYTGDRSLQIWQDFADPTNGTVVSSINGTPIATNQGSAGNLIVNFSDGQAALAANYNDVGQIQFNISDATNAAAPIAGATNAFVVRPADLVVSRVASIAGAVNPAATSATGSGFVAAGEAFRVEVEARNSGGGITPNFGREANAETVSVRSNQLVIPSGGRNGSGGDVSGGASFNATLVSGRFENTAVLFDEVGVIRLRASVGDGDYMGTGALDGTVSGNVGRFYPAGFTAISSSAVPACGDFTYMGQPELAIDYQLEARNVGGAITENYDSTLLGGGASATIALAAENANAGVNLSSRLSLPSSVWVAGELTVSSSTVSFARATSPDGPYLDTQLGLQAIDTLDSRDFVNRDFDPTSTADCVAANNCTALAIGSAMQFVYGRLTVLPGFGPENQALDVPLQAQRFDGASFVRFNDDDCSLYTASAAALSDFSGNLTSGETQAVAPTADVGLIGGADRLSDPLLLSAPGFGNDGEVSLTYTAPTWLRFDWDGSGSYDQNPQGRQTFGRFRGHDRIVFREER